MDGKTRLSCAWATDNLSDNGVMIGYIDIALGGAGIVALGVAIIKKKSR